LSAIRPFLRRSDTVPFGQNVVGDPVAEWVRPRPKHVIDGDAPRVSDDACCGGMSKQCFQAANVVIEKPLGGVVDFVSGRVTEKVGPLSVNKALPGGAAEAAVQPSAPTVWYVARACDQPVDGHAKRKVDDDLKLLGSAKCLQCSPVEVRAVGIKESNALRVPTIDPQGHS